MILLQTDSVRSNGGGGGRGSSPVVTAQADKTYLAPKQGCRQHVRTNFKQLRGRLDSLRQHQRAHRLPLARSSSRRRRRTRLSSSDISKLSCHHFLFFHFLSRDSSTSCSSLPLLLPTILPSQNAERCTIQSLVWYYPLAYCLALL